MGTLKARRQAQRRGPLRVKTPECSLQHAPCKRTAVPYGVDSSKTRTRQKTSTRWHNPRNCRPRPLATVHILSLTHPMSSPPETGRSDPLVPLTTAHSTKTRCRQVHFHFPECSHVSRFWNPAPPRPIREIWLVPGCPGRREIQRGSKLTAMRVLRPCLISDVNENKTWEVTWIHLNNRWAVVHSDYSLNLMI